MMLMTVSALFIVLPLCIYVPAGAVINESMGRALERKGDNMTWRVLPSPYVVDATDEMTGGERRFP